MNQFRSSTPGTLRLLPVWCLVGALGLGMASVAYAKLPAPSEEAKARAAEAAARTAHSNKVADFQLCKSRERTAAHYFKTARSAGQEVKAPVETAACVDPGPFVSAVPASGATGAAAPAAATATTPSGAAAPMAPKRAS